MSSQNTSAVLLGLEKRLRECENLPAGAYTLASGLGQFLNLDDIYVALPTRGSGMRLAASCSHPVLSHVSVTVQWLQGQLNSADEVFSYLQMEEVEAEAEIAKVFPSQFFICQFRHEHWPRPTGGIIGFRDAPLTEPEQAILQHFSDIWCQFYLANRTLKRSALERVSRIGFRKAGLICTLIAVPLLFVKTPMSVVAPLEIESSEVSLVAPLFAGVVDSLEVRANQKVRRGDILARIEVESLERERFVMSLELQQKMTERTVLQTQGLNDPSVSFRFVTIESEINLLHARLEYLDYQISEAVIVAQRDGVIVLSAENEVERRPVDAGQEILRIVSPNALRGRVYLPANNLIPLDTEQDVVASLDKNLLVKFTLPVQFLRPEPVVHDTLGLVYELYVQLPEGLAGDAVSLGDLGKARVYGPKATLIYQIFRRPWLAVRSWLL